MRLPLSSVFQFVLLSLPAVVGCGSDEAPIVTAAERAQFKELACASSLDGLVAQGQADGIVITSAPSYGSPPGKPGVEATAGSFCGGQTTGPCAEALAVALAQAPRCQAGKGLQSGGGFDFPGDCEQLTATRGDEVTAIGDLDQLQAFLGPLDTPEKLSLWLRYTNQRLACQPARPVAGGFEVLAEDFEINCGVYEDRLYSVTSDGTTTIKVTANRTSDQPECTYGRRPAGLAPLTSLPVAPIAAHFARAAHLESASVEAFVRLADELRGHQAPGALVLGCLEAATDEMRHTLAMTSLAERFGGTLEEPCIEPFRERSLLQLALENAVEGCVRETYGALEASFQAEHAVDAEVRAVMTAIAHDETAHATLSWGIHAWLEDHLSVSDWAEVEHAMAAAIDELQGHLGRPRSDSLVSLAGLPDEDTAVALIEGLRAQLWASESLAA